MEYKEFIELLINASDEVINAVKDLIYSEKTEESSLLPLVLRD